MGFPVLDVIVLLPLGAAMAVVFWPQTASSRALKSFALGTAVVELALVVWMAAAFQSGDAHAGLQFITREPWIGPIGISWYLGVDGISVFLVAMAALLFPVAMSVTPPGRSPRAYLGWMLLLESACMVTFLSLNAFLFFFAFDLTLVPGYFIIIDGPGPRQGYAATKFFLYTFAGSAFLFVGILAAFVLAKAHEPAGTTASLDLFSLARGTAHLPRADQDLLFAAFGAAFAVKMPLVPFHTWMPDAYTEAPTGGSMVLAGTLFKLGAYGILRWGIFLFPVGAVDLAPLALTLGVVGIIWGALVAALQRDLKRLVSYGTVVGIGFMVVGLFGFSVQGITGAIVDMVNHGLSTGALFLLVGMVWERRRGLQFAQLGGLSATAPVLGWVFMTVVLADIGLPGLNGFVGELLVLLGTFVTHRWWAVVATSGVVLSAVYLLHAYRRVFHGPVRVAGAVVNDMTWAERLTVAPLLAGIVFIGVYPQPVLARIQPAVNHLVAHMECADPRLKLPSSVVGHGTFAVPGTQVVDLPVTRPLRSAGPLGRRSSSQGPQPGAPRHCSSTNRAL